MNIDKLAELLCEDICQNNGIISEEDARKKLTQLYVDILDKLKSNILISAEDYQYIEASHRAASEYIDSMFKNKPMLMEKLHIINNKLFLCFSKKEIHEEVKTYDSQIAFNGLIEIYSRLRNKFISNDDPNIVNWVSALDSTIHLLELLTSLFR